MGERRKRIGKITGFLLTGMCLMIPFNVYAQSGEIEQISLHMPDVRVYYRSDQQEQNYEAYLGGEALNYDKSAQFSELNEGVDYYILLDISASIPDSQFANIKDGIINFISSEGEKDKCVLLTFGDESNVVLNGSENPQDAAAVVQGLKNDDMETVLFQTLVKTADMIDQAAQTEEKRRVIITITDGEDCVTGQATSNEAVSELNHKGIPMYAIAVDVGKEEYINSFGELVRNTGGTLSIFNSGTCLDLMNQIRNTVQDSYVAFFHSDTNVASNTREDLTVKFLDQQVTDTKEVIPTRWIPDTEAPQIVQWEKESDNELKLTFSEKVLNADNLADYKVERDGEAVAVDSVFYSEKETPYAVLTFKDKLYTGNYQINFSGITDCSMEKNGITKLDSFDLDGAKKGKSTTFWIILIAGIAAVVVAGVIIVVVVTYKKVKKNKGVIYVDGKATLASNVDVKQHVSVVNLPQKTVTFLMKDQINGKCELKITINGSAMAGRSDDCDIYFDDPKMSRQHFALETDGNDVYITDLESSNGTLVNGVRLNRRRKLLPNDEITAGNIQAKIVW
ncbi:FHA domain-containing protein [Blautia wexlerae]|uniref:FHA domain-containing protein n=1 Tax=Blautia wexlerae TaxID=418240 RepID=UPI000414BCCA|nr:FHA domain-containing protein [Blautia wexlerae]